MIFYISDPHLGHENIIKHCNRPFSCADEMDEAIIENWNTRVTNGDTVRIMGDLMFRNRKHPEEYLSRLKGKKHLIVGNHDKAWMKKVDLSRWFESVEMMTFFIDGDRKITMCHYPMMSWPFSNHGGWMIYGHIHENTNMDYWPLIARNDHMLNAGVDINGFAPVTFEEMQQNNLEHIAQAAAKRILDENRDAFASIAQLRQMFPGLFEEEPDD